MNLKTEDYTINERACALVHRVKKSLVFWSPDARFLFAVFARAVEDAFTPPMDVTDAEVEDARRYLSGDMPHLALLGVEAEWVHTAIARLDLPLSGDRPPSAKKSKKRRNIMEQCYI